MPTLLSRVLTVLFLVAALAAAGCGDDDDGGGGGGGGGGGDGKPSKAEFIKQLDAICKESNDKVQKIRAPRSVAEIPEFVDKTKVALEDSIEKANALELPEEDAEGFKDYIEDVDFDELDAIKAAAEDGDEKEVQKLLRKAGETDEKRDAQAKSLGLKQCGSGG